MFEISIKTIDHACKFSFILSKKKFIEILNNIIELESFCLSSLCNKVNGIVGGVVSSNGINKKVVGESQVDQKSSKQGRSCYFIVLFLKNIFQYSFFAYFVLLCSSDFFISVKGFNFRSEEYGSKVKIKSSRVN